MNETNTKPIHRVYIMSADGHVLMPTKRYGHVRRLLNSGRAKVVSRRPFQIQLLYATSTYTQDTWLNADAGYKHIGLSVQTKQEEIFSAEAHLLEGQRERNAECKMYQTQKRQDLRYREPRFDNRKKPEGWLAPSIQHKYDSHLHLIELAARFMPITYRTVETATFDIQQIKQPDISGTDYQDGPQKDFGNLREYIFHRDHHECQSPKCQAQRTKGRKTESVPLQVHHLGYWKGDDSDRPDNLITLCIHCHTSPHHQKGGMLWGWEPKLRSFRPDTFMSTIAKRLVRELGAIETFGYLTKANRIALGLPKSHANDAFAITGKLDMPRAVTYQVIQRRRNNRSLETWKDAQYVDLRTGQTVKAQELNNGRRTRNKNLNTENLRPYRGEKKRDGKRSIRTARYSIQPGDLVRVGHRRYLAVGTHCKGAQIKLRTGDTVISVSSKTVSVIKFGQGFNFIETRLLPRKRKNSSLA